jgi:hypothetical protein
LLPKVHTTRKDVVKSTIKSSYLWKYFEQIELTENMRMSCIKGNEIEKQHANEFNRWILNVGDGRIVTDEGEEWIKIPSKVNLQNKMEQIKEIVQATYPNLQTRYKDQQYIEERMILCRINKMVDEINKYIMR